MGEVRMKKNKIKVLTIITLSLVCLMIIGCKSLNAKVFENNGRFISIKDNIPSNSILLQNGELFYAGWIKEGSGKIIPAQVYNLKTHKAEILGKLNIPRANYSQILLNDGKVLIFGGQTIDKFGRIMEPVKISEIYNPKVKTFSKVSDLNYARAFGTKCVLLQDGRVFIISPNLPVEIFDPVTEKFTTVGNIRQYTIKSPDKSITQTLTVKFSTINEFFSVIPVLLKDGRVLLVGNSFKNGNAEIFDPKTNSFTLAEQMKYKRSQFTATLLNDGRVLVGGGVNNNPKYEYGIGPTEVFDPKTNSFTVTGSLKNKRYDHSAILLSNGKVLIVGGNYGHSEDLKYLKEAELFDPKIEVFEKIGSNRKTKVYPDMINISKDQVLIPYGYQTEIYKY